MNADTFVSVVLPLHDDADVLESAVDDVVAIVRERWVNYEIVLVDDGSTDGTPLVVERLLEKHAGLRYLQLSRSFGVETAILAGLDSVIGDVVVVLEPALDPADLIPKFVEEARSAGGIVFGVRTHLPDESFLHEHGRKLYRKAQRWLLEVDLPDAASLYMAFTRQVLNAVMQIKDKARALRIFGSSVGFPRRQVLYEPKARRHPSRRESLADATERAVTMIVTNTVKPLRLVSLLALFASFMNVVYIGYIFVVAMMKKTQEGWITTSLQNASMFLALFVILTILAEYVGRLLIEVRERPAYYVAQERCSSVMIPNEERRNVVHESR